jgi:hypothetical protein
MFSLLSDCGSDYNNENHFERRTKCEMYDVCQEYKPTSSGRGKWRTRRGDIANDIFLPVSPPVPVSFVTHSAAILRALLDSIIYAPLTKSTCEMFSKPSPKLNGTLLIQNCSPRATSIEAQSNTLQSAPGGCCDFGWDSALRSVGREYEREI